MSFADRFDAGRRLASQLTGLRGSEVLVLGLPRGGVPVAYEVAKALGAPLDVLLVRKLGVPFQRELGMGAIGEGGVRVINEEVVRLAGVSRAELDAVEAQQRTELERRARKYRGNRRRHDLTGKTVVIVDDGVATGSTAKAACQVARAHRAARVILAVPVAPLGWQPRIGPDADAFICLETPRLFSAIGQFYDDFAQTTDDEVVQLLERAASHGMVEQEGDRRDDPPARETEVEVLTGGVRLAAQLKIPEEPSGLVIFVHGSGSGRHSPRNRQVAGVLNAAGLGTLLFDLLTSDEEADRSNVFDIELLGRRLLDVTRWCREDPEWGRLPLGYFGASTGAGAALWAASEPGAEVAAIVSRGGRPDLAGARLGNVTAPTLLIVGGADKEVLRLNDEALGELRCEAKLLVIPGATHLFEENTTLEAAALAARDWFRDHLNEER